MEVDFSLKRGAFMGYYSWESPNPPCGVRLRCMVRLNGSNGPFVSGDRGGVWHDDPSFRGHYELDETFAKTPEVTESTPAPKAGAEARPWPGTTPRLGCEQRTHNSVLFCYFYRIAAFRISGMSLGWSLFLFL